MATCLETLESKNTWKTLEQVVEQVKDLKREIEKLEQTVKKYIDKFRGESEDYDKTLKILKNVQEIKEELIDLKEKASEKIIIAFVGSTSSGKSSVINCVLRDDRLPVDELQCTRNSIHVCTTEGSSWSVLVDKKPQNENDKESVKELLSSMCHSEAKEQRKIKNITKESVVEVFWPKDQCTRMPHNVVLVDTPGYGQNSKSMKVTTDSCKKADIIVTVMDIRSPIQETLSNLVKEVNCQYTFGVYTNWDRCRAGRKKDDVDRVRAKYKKKYLKMREAHNEVFFVDVESVERIKKAEEAGGTDENNDFFKFEKCLAKSARNEKGKLLTKQVNSIISKSQDALSQFKAYVDNRSRAKNEQLTGINAALDSGIKIFKKGQEKYDMFGEVVIKTLLEQLETGLKENPESEKNILKNFSIEANKKNQGSSNTKTRNSQNFR